MWQRIPAAALAAALCLPLCLLAACDFDDWSERYTEDFRHSYPLAPGGRLTVENFNGSIEISSWSDNSVEISGTKYAPRKDLLDAIRIDIAAQPDSIQVRTVRPSGQRGRTGARYFIRVPKRTRLENITTANGQIRAEEIDGPAKLKTSNGAVHTEDLRGTLDVQTSNGRIEVEGHEGATVLRTSNARIRAEDVRGALDATTTNGNVRAEVEGGPEHTVRIRTTNGSVDLEIDGAAGEVRASSTNGGITLRLPEKIDAHLVAATTNGTVESELEVASKGAASKGRLEGQLGAGGPLIDLSTSNGSIRIVRQ